jgi:hypothetical protein
MVVSFINKFLSLGFAGSLEVKGWCFLVLFGMEKWFFLVLLKMEKWFFLILLGMEKWLWGVTADDFPCFQVWVLFFRPPV